MRQLPSVPVQAQAAILDGGLDMISPPGYAKPGTVKFAINYELEFGGGYRRTGGFERYSGQFQPHRQARAHAHLHQRQVVAQALELGVQWVLGAARGR